MQAVAGSVTAVWSATENSFVIDSTSTHIPTKLYIYDADDRLVAVELPGVANPLNSDAVERPRYEYGYNEQGNQTLIRDPLGRETRFTFTARGQQATRTLPLGFGSDGIPSAAELSSLQSNASSLPFTEGFTYDDRGRQVLHVSFEGVVSENIYDGFGRLAHINYYADQTAYTGETISERWSYEYDDYGRKNVAQHSVLSSPSTFTTTRIEETVYDDRGRVIAESVPEGVLAYTYDSQGRMTSTAVFSEGDDFQIDDPKRITSYGYDLLGRLVSVTEDRTPTNTSDDPQLQSDYTFDLAGRMDTQTILDPSTNQSVTTDYDYDQLGRLATQTDTDESNNVLAAYDYTVRADGKRTSLEETHWFDTDEDGVVDTGEQKTTTYDWTYDAVGRLTDEVIDHWDNAIDQTESYTYDLTGNRLQLDRDRGNNGVDEVITYEYDANDRLVEELFDDLAGSVNDTTTIYVYDHTQQTSKSVASGIGFQPVSAQHFTYNLQGRIATVINEGYTSGTLSSRERTSYEYSSGSYRVALVNEVDSGLNNTYTLTSSTEFLADSRNFTGYTQTIRETTVNADDSSKTVDYTFGHDEIAQRTVQRDDEGTITSDETLVFGHDGHGSVRVLYDLAETTAGIVNQVATFAAYGQLLAVHAANAALAGTSEAAFKSNLGYSGEQWDASLRMQNLRARAYDPRNGRFIGLDPFAGNMQDPQSLHKYAYVHGDPIQGIDPSGKFFGSVGGLLGGALFGQVGIGGGNAEDTPFYVHPWKSFPGYDKDGGIQGPDGLGLLRMSLWMNNDPQRAKSFLKAFQDEWGDLVTKAAAANDVPEGLVWASIFAEVVNFRYNDYIDIGDPLGASSFGPGQLSQATKRYYQTSARWNETMAGTDMTRGQMFKSQIASLDQLGQIKLPNYKRASDIAIITKQVYELSYVLSVQAKEVLLAAQGGGALALPTGGGITVDPMSANYLASNDAQGIFSQHAVGPDFHKNLPRLSIILVMMNRHHYRVTGGDGTEPYENRFTIQTPQAMFLKQAFQSGVLRFDGFKLKVQ